MNAEALERVEVSWVCAHEALSRLAKARARADAEEGRWLLAALRSAVHVHLGFGSFGEYVERLFGYGRRFIREKLRVAEALEELPALAMALETGAISWSAVRKLTRVVVSDTEAEWLQVAKGKTARQLEELVAGKRPGDMPDSPPDARARRHALRFEVAAETLAVFWQALEELRRRSGSSLDDDAVLMEMARQVLAGPEDEGDAGRARYQIALTVCAECGAGRQEAGPDAVAIGADAVAMATCDAQHLGRVDVFERPDLQPANDASAPHVGDRANQTPPGVAACTPHAGDRADRTPPAVGASASELVDRAEPALPPVVARSATHVSDRAAPTPFPVVATSPLPADDRQHLARPLTIDAPQVGKAQRAQQAVPPSVRRAVLRRDQGRCRVPGCGNCRFLDVHHIELRSEGGSHQAGNLLTICGAHHRALHRGELLVERDDCGGVCFRHADGSVYGCVANPKILDMLRKVFSALRTMGFRERDVRRAFEVIRERDDLRNASIQDWLRAALQMLTPVRR